MTRLYVLGGRQKTGSRRHEWHAYDAAVVLEVDLDSGAVEERLRYTSPPDVCPDADPSFIFKAGTLIDDSLYVCTQTEVLKYHIPSFKQTLYLSHPWFNDLHHVRPSAGGGLLVANTGLDMVLEMSADGQVLQHWSATDDDTWSRFSRQVDYRRVPTTKPHAAHPNYVFRVGESIWVTRAACRDAVCLATPRERIEFSGDVPVHDGRRHGGHIYFTAVDGRIIAVDAESLEIARTTHLGQMVRSRDPLGWCRGLQFIDNDHVVVGLSRLRPTRWDRNVSWARGLLGRRRWGRWPTRLLLLDLTQGQFCWQISLEPHLNAVFSIHLAP